MDNINGDLIKYNEHLLSLNDQWNRLRLLNQKLSPSMQLADTVFKCFKGVGDEHIHNQSVDSLLCFYVQKETLEKTFDYNWELIKLTQPASGIAGFSTSGAFLNLNLSCYQSYEPGVHLVEINLIHGWIPGRRLSVTEVRESAIHNELKLAGPEVLIAYALQQPELLIQQNGDTLPYCVLAGLNLVGAKPGVPDFYWESRRSKVYVGVQDLEIAGGYAAPTVKSIKMFK